MSVLSSFWNGFLERLSIDKKYPVLLSVLKQVKPLELTDKSITVGCERQGIGSYLEKHRPQIEQELYKHLKKHLVIKFTIVETQKKPSETPLLSFAPSTEDRLIKSGLHHKYSFDNFAVSSTNQVAYAAAQAVAKNPGTAYNPLFFYGGVGVGKTHLAQAVARAVLEVDDAKRVYFCPGDNFTNELVESIRDKSQPRFRQKYRRLNLLIVDDIQFIAGKAHMQEEFFHTFNSIVSSGGQVILTSDRPPSDIKNLEDRLRSRFLGGLIVDVQPPDFDLRTAILLIKAKEKSIEIDIEAAKIIAEQITDSRGLEGTLLSIYALILGKKDRIDLEAVEFYFSQKTKTKEKKISPNDVVKAVCSFYGVKQSYLKGAVRTDAIALPRQVAMYLLHRELHLKLTEVAEILKRKDHTTVIHANRKVENLIMKDSLFKQDIDRITSLLSQST